MLWRNTSYLVCPSWCDGSLLGLTFSLGIVDLAARILTSVRVTVTISVRVPRVVVFSDRDLAASRRALEFGKNLISYTQLSYGFPG